MGASNKETYNGRRHTGGNSALGDVVVETRRNKQYARAPKAEPWKPGDPKPIPQKPKDDE